MFRTKQKTVESVEENLGFFGKIKNAFKIKKIKAKTQTKKQKKTKNGNIRKQSQKTTEAQVKKIFRLHEQNPNLSTCDIAKTVGMSEVLVRYYIKKGKKASLSQFKKAKRKLKKSIKVTNKPISKRKADEKLDQLYEKERYPVEHQSDPRYFAGSEPPQSVATDEAFQDQKRRNNINRVVVAKKIKADKEPKPLTPKEAEQISQRHVRIANSHQKKPPKIHLECCSYCNPKSNLMDKDYDHIVRQESWRRHEYSEKQKKLTEKEKELDDREKKQKNELSVAEEAQQGTQLCRTCDERIPYSQATRSFSIYNEYYCADHEPRISGIDK